MPDRAKSCILLTAPANRRHGASRGPRLPPLQLPRRRRPHGRPPDHVVPGRRPPEAWTLPTGHRRPSSATSARTSGDDASPPQATSVSRAAGIPTPAFCRTSIDRHGASAAPPRHGGTGACPSTQAPARIRVRAQRDRVPPDQCKTWNPRGKRLGPRTGRRARERRRRIPPPLRRTSGLHQEECPAPGRGHGPRDV